jgi:two-component system chemotaxis response regulator CheY
MKVLIVEDDFTSRFLLQEILKKFGPSHVAVNGNEAVMAVEMALRSGEPYHLICLDIMMPEMDGQTALKQIRETEKQYGVLTNGVKIIMTTAQSDIQNVSNAYSNLCDGYLTKPIDKGKLIRELQLLGLID